MPQSLPILSGRVAAPYYCYLDSRIRALEGLHVACAGRETCRPDFHVARDHFACHGIEFVSAGRGGVRLDGKSYPLLTGSMFCYGPRTRHEIHTDPDEPMTKYFIDFFGDDVEALLHRHGIAPGRIIQVLDIELMRSTFERLIAEGRADLENSRELCASYLRVMILKSAQGLESNTQRRPVTENAFERAVRFVDANYLTLRDLGDIAEGVHLGAPYLCRLFRKHRYPSPFQYLTRKKLSRAAELLVGEGKSVKVAATEVGYGDPYHFSRLFKNQFGQSPQHFVQRARQYGSPQS